MGSLFSTPRPVVPAPVAAPNPAGGDGGETADEAASRAREEALQRRRYGRAGLVATGYRGLLSDRIDGLGGGRNLLGQ